MAGAFAWLKAPFGRRRLDVYADADRASALLAASGLFDASHYLIQAPDVHEAGVDPIRHFCDFGWREGRRPNPCFDPAWYRDLYLSRSAQMNPLVHYVCRGEAAGCHPIAYFDPAWYRRAYGLPRATSPLAHYLAHRRSQRVAPNPHFDLAFYLAHHAAEIGPNRDPFAHLVRCGAARDLDPSADFNSATYRAGMMPKQTEPPTDLSAHELRVPLVHFCEAAARVAATRRR